MSTATAERLPPPEMTLEEWAELVDGQLVEEEEAPHIRCPSMMASHGMAAFMALAVATAGCGAASGLPGGGSGGSGGSGNPLDGTWIGTLNSDGTMGTETITLSADGTAIESSTITGALGTSCSGTVELTGTTWTSTATTITLTGGVCTGGVTCYGAYAPCATDPTDPTTICNYTLSDGDDTLVITCGGPSVTLTRQG